MATTLVHMRAVILLFAVIPAWVAWHAGSGPYSTATAFSFTGRPQLYVVPAGVRRVGGTGGAADGPASGHGGWNGGGYGGAGPRSGWPERPSAQGSGLGSSRRQSAPVERTTGVGPRRGKGHPVPAKPSPAAVTAFYRWAAERTARLMGKPAPRWKACPTCKLAFDGPDTVPENPATGATPGDWQP